MREQGRQRDESVTFAQTQRIMADMAIHRRFRAHVIRRLLQIN